MSLVFATRSAIAFAVCALAAGCGTVSLRQVTTTAVLDRGTVSCHSRRLIWESSNVSHGCDVTVTCCGTEECPALLLSIMPAAAGAIEGPHGKPTPIVRMPEQTTEPAGAAGLKVKLRDVQALWLACGEPRSETHSGECSYTTAGEGCVCEIVQTECDK